MIQYVMLAVWALAVIAAIVLVTKDRTGWDYSPQAAHTLDGTP